MDLVINMDGRPILSFSIIQFVGGKMMVVIGWPKSNLSFSLFWLCGPGYSDGGSPELSFLYLGLMVR